MDNQTAALLRVIARDLEQTVMPSVAEPNVQTMVGMMKMLLDRAAKTEATTASTRPPASQDATLKAMIASAEAEQRAKLEGEATSRDSAWAASGSGRVTAGASGGSRMGPITAAQIVSYLQGKSDWSWVESATVSQTAGGFSKDTFIVSLRGKTESRDIVLRRDQAFRPLLTSVADEKPVLAAMSSRGFPAPRPLWLETDRAVFGAAVIALEKASGSADLTAWSDEPARRATVVENSARLLAQLHAYAPDDAGSNGSGVPGARGATPGEFVSDLAAYWTQIAPAANPLMEKVLAWLADAAPTAYARRVIVHGDYGLHNLLVDGATVSAVLDWEFWHIGDAREDLAYVRSFMDKIGEWPRFLAAYESAGGVSAEPVVEQFYSVLSSLRVAIGCYALQHAFASGEAGIDSKMIFVGSSFADRFLIDAAKIAAQKL